MMIFGRFSDGNEIYLFANAWHHFVCICYDSKVKEGLKTAHKVQATMTGAEIAIEHIMQHVEDGFIVKDLYKILDKIMNYEIDHALYS